MSLSKSEFNNAFTSTISAQFDSIPCDEDSIVFDFSDKFVRKMEKLIKAQRKSYWNLINKTSKRVAIAIIAVITVFSASFSVKAIREPIVEFIIEVFKTFTSYTPNERENIDGSKVYSVTKLPDGFKQTVRTTSTAAIETVYENDNGDSIKLYQKLSGNGGTTVDNQHNKCYKVEIDSCMVEIYHYGQYDSFAIWVEDNAPLQLSVHYEIDLDELIELVNSVE